MPFPNWEDRISENEAIKVRKYAKIIGDGCHEKDCFWRGYKMEMCFVMWGGG